MKRGFLILPGILIIGFSNLSCNKNKFDVDVSSINVELEIERFEKDFFSAKADSLNSKHNELYRKYGEFYRRYIENIAGIGLVNDPAISYGLNSFVSDKYVKEVVEDTEKKFGDEMDDVKNGLQDAFRFGKYYFPSMVIPRIVTFVSGFQYTVAVTDSVLGIGLDMYLGADYINYNRAGFPLYKIERTDRKFIVSDAIKAWLMTEFFSAENKIPEDMLATMVRQGIIMYLTDALLWQTDDSVKSGFSKNQLEWFSKNEFNIWAYLVDNELIFSSDPQLINKFFNEAPFTSGLPKESPPKAGIWVGWQIVKSYMDNNPEISIPDLVNKPNPREILEKSKYKPKK